MKLKVRLFARARDLAGQDFVELDVGEPAQVKDVRRALAAQVPAVAPLVPHLLVAVGTDYATETTPVTSTSDVACFPPVSGG